MEDYLAQLRRIIEHLLIRKLFSQHVLSLWPGIKVDHKFDGQGCQAVDTSWENEVKFRVS